MSVGTCIGTLSLHRTDLPRYYIYSRGRLVEDTLDLSGFEQSWGDKVSFYLGCSFTFEGALSSSGIKMRNMELCLSGSMYLTNITLKAVGAFRGSMCVTMRAIKRTQVAQAFLLTAQYPKSHGAPIHIGNPVRIGVNDLSTAEFGDPGTVEEGEVPMFWACGVSTQEVVKKAGMLQDTTMLSFSVGECKGHSNIVVVVLY